MNALVLVNGEVEIHLHGAGTSAPLRGARRVECTPVGDGWLERVEVFFEGLPGAIQVRRAEIERILARSGTQLRLETYPGAEAVEARLAGGTCQALAWNSGGGSSALRLDLLRAEPWQGAEAALALSNPGGTNVTGGLEIYGHTDSAHWNYADVDGDTLVGDRPGTVRLEIENASGSESIGDVLVSADAGDAPGEPGRWLEGESASGGSLAAQTDCSGGAARQVEANSTGGVLLSWTLDANLLVRLAGREVRPTARMAAPAEMGKVWAWWQVRSGTEIIWTSLRELLRGEVLEDLPAVPLPPLPLMNPAGLTLDLCGKTASGTAGFSVDFVQLSPLDGWRRYRTAGGMPPGGVLVDDGFARRVYVRSGAGETSSYAAAGAPLRLQPGRNQRLYLLHNAAVDVPLRVRAWYRPAWANV